MKSDADKNRIHKLPAEVFHKIAAGEVIERPASVVKELVENALDAEAAEIRVELQDGGKRIIRIYDNGTGMTPADAALCFESHATSKIAQVDDLDRIETLGFRGEALASIAAVSRVNLKTTFQGQEGGTWIEREAENVIRMEDTAFPRGTQIEVRDLFFNLPARKKFLRSERAELSRAVKSLTYAALAYPAVSFSLKHGQRRVFSYPAVQGLKERIYQVYGKERLDDLIEVRHAGNGIMISGMASRPPSGRRDRRHQFFFINRRPVGDKTLQAALNQAYQPFLEKNTFAEAYLFIDMPPAEVDVNVHPAKAEVRFRDSRGMFRLVLRTVENALLKEMGIKQVQAPGRRMKTPAPVSSSMVQEESPAFFPQQQRSGPDPESAEWYAPWGKEEEFGPRVLGQFLDMYIVAVDEKGLLIIDQHNAHERVLYEQFLKLDREQNWPRKMPLEPLLLDLTLSQKTSLKENRERLEETGFQVDAMGGNSYALKEFPDIFTSREAGQVFLSLLEEAASRQVEDKKKHILATMACKTAIKAGESLQMSKMRYLVQELFQTSNPGVCPHGRPITLRLDRAAIEKGLGRK
jgi:DNA mismatch repair protein MutL